MAAATKDAVLASAVDLARAAAEEVAEDAALVGEHLGPVVEGERLVSHRFVATAPGYRGWYWSVTVARVPRGRKPTICEIDLLPGQEAVLAPTWVPWSERLRPGDVGPGDVLPYLEQDERLEPGYTATGEADADELAIFELGLGRERVLSREGRAEAAERWYTGTRGPTAPQAVAASAPCSTCAFLVLMAGSLRTEFGVCANEWAPDDGRVVSMDHGCGAHSQTDVTPPPSDWPDQSPVIDEHDVEIVRVQGEKSDQADEAGQSEASSESEASAESDAGPEPEAGPDAAPEPEAPAEPDPAPTADEG
ncbi:DUF3027 domain-containing protein [Actinotalea sp. C106]|uniref:DUF3027 domain-containing protein n=1 Tax=Actinotalea sp. C106 TaxID=2908644 RepID=UPI00202797D9|nr:DUF3027 domain-containing protein [Actinotalea sp. C106]